MRDFATVLMGSHHSTTTVLERLDSDVGLVGLTDGYIFRLLIVITMYQSWMIGILYVLILTDEELQDIIG